MLTHWKKLNNPDYIGAYAFEPGEEKAVTIDKVTREVITGEGGKKEECTVLHFQQKNVKPLILNVTNAKSIEALLGTPYVEEWKGKSIVLVVRKVPAFGERVDAVRIKPEKDVILCSRCGGRVKAAKDMSAAQVAAYARERFNDILCADCMKGTVAREGNKGGSQRPAPAVENS